MKKLIIALAFIIPVAGFLGIKALSRSQVETNLAGAPVIEEAVKAETAVSPAETENAEIIPARLIIPKLGVNTVVEHVAEDAEGRMDVPEDFGNVAWWKPGYKPGAVGSAVLAGHFDNPDGSPSVFYDLGDLVPGDTIVVEDSLGNTLEFEVTDSELYKDAKFPIETVFGAADVPRLNLITCAGIFDKSSLNYSDRLVVFTELKTINN